MTVSAELRLEHQRFDEIDPVGNVLFARSYPFHGCIIAESANRFYDSYFVRFLFGVLFMFSMLLMFGLLSVLLMPVPALFVVCFVLILSPFRMTGNENDPFNSPRA